LGGPKEKGRFFSGAGSGSFYVFISLVGAAQASHGVWQGRARSALRCGVGKNRVAPRVGPPLARPRQFPATGRPRGPARAGGPVGGGIARGGGGG